MLPQYSGGTAIGKNPFAVQLTSQVDGAQQMTINFTNNRLLGSANFLPTYKTSKARVCVTVGMMTTGYDCPDLLNLGCSVQSFAYRLHPNQRTRHSQAQFLQELFDTSLKDDIKKADKTAYKLFDFFANCQYFDEDFNYDEVIKLPIPGGPGGVEISGGGVIIAGTYNHT
jgi:type I restriction enzyme R subunit